MAAARSQSSRQPPRLGMDSAAPDNAVRLRRELVGVGLAEVHRVRVLQLAHELEGPKYGLRPVCRHQTVRQELPLVLGERGDVVGARDDAVRNICRWHFDGYVSYAVRC